MRKFFILLLVSLFSLASPVHAEVDFSNKTITWVVPFKEGGGTSRFARFIQPFLTKYLPGNPDIQIMHIPGGGAIKGSNYFQKNAIESAGGKFIGFYGLIGQKYEVMVISEFDELTDYMSVIASAIIGKGVTDIKTVNCYTGEDVKIAATKALSGEINYKAADS